MRGQCLRLPCRAVELDRRLIDRGDEFAQRLDRIIDRVGNRTGDILGHGRLYGQIALREVRHLIQQSHDGLLITVILHSLSLGAVLRLQIGAQCMAQAGIQQREWNQRAERAQSRKPGRQAETRQHDSACRGHDDQCDGREHQAQRSSCTRYDFAAHVLAPVNGGSSSSDRSASTGHCSVPRRNEPAM